MPTDQTLRQAAQAVVDAYERGNCMMPIGALRAALAQPETEDRAFKDFAAWNDHETPVTQPETPPKVWKCSRCGNTSADSCSAVGCFMAEADPEVAQPETVAEDAARLGFLLANCVVEDDDGFTSIKFETSRHFATHPRPLEGWIRNDIDTARRASPAGEKP